MLNSALEGASASSFFLELIPIFGNLEIEVTEVAEGTTDDVPTRGDRE